MKSNKPLAAREEKALTDYNLINETNLRYQAELQLSIDAHNLLIKGLVDKLVAEKPNTLIRCESLILSNPGCNQIWKISQCVYVQPHQYIQPSGCTDSDYWRKDDGLFICPGCNKLNRLYYRKHYEVLKPYFKSIEERHDR